MNRTSDRHPALDYLMDRALMRMLFTADGSTTNYAPTEYVTRRADRKTAIGRLLADAGPAKTQVVKGSGDGPCSALAEDIEWLAEKYAACRNHRQRLQWIKAAQEAYARLLHAPKCDPALVKGTREYRERVASDTRPCRIIAKTYGLSLRDVVAYRKEFAA